MPPGTDRPLPGCAHPADRRRDPAGGKRAARSRRARNSGHHRARRADCGSRERTAAVLLAAHAWVPDSRRPAPAPCAAARPRRHRMEGSTRTMTEWTSLTYAVVDVEGNGQQPPDLVELAIVPIVGGEIGEARSWLVRPERPIAHFATRIHGLTNQDVASAPAFDEVAEEIGTLLGGPTIVAHNANVDVGVLSRKLPDWKP